MNWYFQENPAIGVPHNAKACDVSQGKRSQTHSSSLRDFARTQVNTKLPWTLSLNLEREHNNVIKIFKATPRRTWEDTASISCETQRHQQHKQPVVASQIFVSFNSQRDSHFLSPIKEVHLRVSMTLKLLSSSKT